MQFSIVFEQVIILDKFQEQVVELQQKIIITNDNLLFQFGDHNNNLLVPKLWKRTRSVIILIRSRGSAMKLYYFPKILMQVLCSL